MTVLSQTVEGASTAGNRYYGSPADVAPGTRARAVDINTIDAAVDAAFDKLPDPDALIAGTVGYAVDTGTAANAYQVSMPKPVLALLDGFEVVLRTVRANTGAATLNVDGIGALVIKRIDGTDLRAGDILANAPIALRYVAGINAFVSSRGDSITRADAEAILALGATPGNVAITSLGKGTLTPLQVVRLNAAGTALEGAAVASGTDLAMVHAIAISF